MPKGKPVILANKSFPTKQAAHAYFKEMLSRYQPETIVSAEDAKDLVELLNRHPNAAHKRGVGVHHFEVMSADYGTKCFCVVRTNGTREDFSYITCVNADA
jgi:hypothetical protein